MLSGLITRTGLGGVPALPGLPLSRFRLYSTLSRTEKQGINLSLNLSIPQQREAWHILRTIPSGQRTDAVCRMILEHKRQTELLNTIRAAIREELRGVGYIPAAEKTEQPGAGDVDDNVLGFLLSLQGDEKGV